MRGRHFSTVVSRETVRQAQVEFAKQMIGTIRTASPRLVVQSPVGTRSAVEVHTVSLDDGRDVVGLFGVIEAAADPAPPVAPSGTLTPRQHQVLVELARGATTEQIASSLGIERETVRNHVRGVLRALGVHSRLEAVVEARRRGLVGP